LNHTRTLSHLARINLETLRSQHGALVAALGSESPTELRRFLVLDVRTGATPLRFADDGTARMATMSTATRFNTYQAARKAGAVLTDGGKPAHIDDTYAALIRCTEQRIAALVELP